MENVVNEAQAAVVASQEQPQQAQNEEVAAPEAVVQSRMENAGFRRMRLENEKKDEIIQSLRAQNERYEQAQIMRQMQEDLEAIQKMDPTVEDLASLGENFTQLIAAGIDAKTAFAAIRQVREAERVPAPPAPGAVDGHSMGEKDFYLPEEVDRLSESDLEDPTIWERVRRSMTKWK